MSRRARRALCVGVLLAAAGGLWGCAEDATKPAPSSGHALSGVVRLTWLETGAVGALIGSHVIDDAEGVRVQLVVPGGAVLETTTHAGHYVFQDLAPGTYGIRAPVLAEDSVVTLAVTLTNSDVAVADTLQLGPTAGVRDYSNPFPFLHGVGVEFTTQSTANIAPGSPGRCSGSRAERPLVSMVWGRPAG